MNLHVTRDVFTPTTTLGVLRIVYDGALMYDGKGWTPHQTAPVPLDFGFSCEDEDRGLFAAMPASELKRRKLKNETAIPCGTYSVRFTFSPKYRRNMPLVEAVPGFAGIRIHAGNSEADTAGCILPGLGRSGVRVTRSGPAVAWLEKRIAECEARSEPVTLTIDRDPIAWGAYRTRAGFTAWPS